MRKRHTSSVYIEQYAIIQMIHTTILILYVNYILTEINRCFSPSLIMYPDTEEKRNEHMLTEARKHLFVQAVRDRERSMYRVALVMLRRSADAEDAVAAGIEKAYGRLDSIRDDKALPSYLMRCTINACHDVLRRRKRENSVEDVEPYVQAAYPEIPIWTYLMGLEEKYSVPLALRFGEDMTIAEIASTLRLPQGTVSTRISRGLKMLRSQIER